jgi:hypothetical protein
MKCGEGAGGGSPDGLVVAAIAGLVAVLVSWGVQEISVPVTSSVRSRSVPPARSPGTWVSAGCRGGDCHGGVRWRGRRARGGVRAARTGDGRRGGRRCAGRGARGGASPGIRLRDVGDRPAVSRGCRGIRYRPDRHRHRVGEPDRSGPAGDCPGRVAGRGRGWDSTYSPPQFLSRSPAASGAGRGPRPFGNRCRGFDSEGSRAGEARNGGRGPGDGPSGCRRSCRGRSGLR